MSSFLIRCCSKTMPSSRASGPRRAAGHVDVDRDDLVDTLGDGVAVPVRAAAVGARAHRDDVLRFGHLLVEALDGRRHLVGHGPGHDHEVGLARAGRQRDDAEAHHVVAGRAERGAHLDRAAGQAPLVHPQAVRTTEVEQRRQRFGHPPFVYDSHAVIPNAARPCATRTRGQGAGRTRRFPSRRDRSRRSARAAWPTGR